MSAYSPYNPMHSTGMNGTSNGYNYNGTETLSRMVVDGNYIDGSWELAVHVEDLGHTVRVRVLGDLTLGGLMHRIAECAGVKQSWSDHALWWEDRNMWLLHNRSTLDQYGVQSDANLVFRRMHGDLQVVLPSLITVVLRVNYAARVFSVVRSICKELNIRHPEELSLSLPITKAHLKSNLSLPTLRHAAKHPNSVDARTEKATLRSKLSGTMSANQGFTSTTDGVPHSPYGTLHSATGTMMRLQSENSLDRERLDATHFADCAFRRSAKTVFSENWLMKPKNLIQKARLNSGWLDSSRSLLEHGIKPPPISSPGEEVVPPPTVYLSFKFYAFYDLNLKYDAVRIHQLYEQARWSILSGQLSCTEDEMVVFAAFQLQAELQSAAANQTVYQMGYTDPSSLNHYPTLGAASTIGTAWAPNQVSPGLRPNPDPTGLTYLSPAATYFNNSGPVSASLMRLPGAASPLSGVSLVDGGSSRHGSERGGMDEVDELLAELEQSCGVAEETGSTARTLQTHNVTTLAPGGTLRSKARATGPIDVPDTAEIPSLQESLRVYRDRTLLIRRYKVLWVVIVEARLYLYKTHADTELPLIVYSLRDCTITPDVSTAMQKYILKLSLFVEPNRENGNRANGVHAPYPVSPSTATRDQSANREEVWLRFDTAEQYARWFAACTLGSKGKTLASRVAYEKEMETILEILRLQVPGPTPVISTAESVKYLGDLSNFCAERIIRKARSKEYLRQRITEAHVNIRDVSLLESKFKYIQAWQRLTHFGRSYFTIQFDRGSNLGVPGGSGGLFSTPVDDVIAICQGRFEIVSPHSGEVLRAWNFTDLRSWNVNWDAGKVLLDFRSEQISFRPLCTNCKTIVEFIGGYVFLSQRTPEKSQDCNERLFHRLTGATD
ncbi:FERM central domain [Fasciola gigantica]|uniref:FERM central domain n=1 Tax=Fasciola gigantica TaxID=46835 RepID=A0A504YIV0_FASGI|nr:FERM central domain [Fasciola gigantica]